MQDSDQRQCSTSREELSSVVHALALARSGARFGGKRGDGFKGGCAASESALEQALRDLERWRRNGIEATAHDDPSYPELLRRIVDPPPVIFHRGAPGALSRPTIALVGSRRGSSGGCTTARALAQALAAAGNCVVSGLAAGIDAAAHYGALSSMVSGGTVAVLGSGLNKVYPAMNSRLADDIVSAGGALLSQFEPEEPPYPVHFLERNRVIAGLSLGVLVVEAAERSGSLVTARYALDEGREVLAVPGAIDREVCAGSNRLLRQGAAVVLSVDDIIESVPGLHAPNRSGLGLAAPECATPQSELLLLLAEHGALHVEELIRRSGVTRAEVERIVLELELEGRVVRGPGNTVAVGR